MPDEDEQKRKRAIFEAMSPRRQQKILKKGYDAWDPFLPPKEPSRFFGTSKQAQGQEADEAVRAFESFVQGLSGQSHGTDYLSGAKEMCVGLYRGEARYRGMYEFCRWMAARGQQQKK
jgi:hypothetical protein